MLLLSDVYFKLLVLVEEGQKLVIVSLTPVSFFLVFDIALLVPHLFLCNFITNFLNLTFVLVIFLGLLYYFELHAVCYFLVLKDLFIILYFLLAPLDCIDDGCGVLVRFRDGVYVV